MNTPRIARTAVVAALALGLGAAAPAWADGWHHEDEGFGPAAIFGLAAAVIAAPYLLGAPRVVAPPPVYAAPPVVYSPPPAYVYAPPVYAAPRYYGGDGEGRWHRDGWRREGDR